MRRLRRSFPEPVTNRTLETRFEAAFPGQYVEVNWYRGALQPGGERFTLRWWGTPTVDEVAASYADLDVRINYCRMLPIADVRRVIDTLTAIVGEIATVGDERDYYAAGYLARVAFVTSTRGLTLGGRELPRIVDDLVEGGSIPAPTVDEVSAWLASQSSVVRLAGLRLSARLPQGG